MFNAVAVGSRKLEAIAVVTPDAEQDSDPGQKMPCGACRQVMAEIMISDGTIIVEGIGEFKIDDLIPLPFELKVVTGKSFAKD